jgi:hypothetical protein
MNFGKMKLGAKLISAFILVSALSAIVSVIGVRNMGQISANADTTYRQDLVGLNLIQQANADVLRVGTYLRNAILASTADQRTASLAQAEKALASARGHRAPCLHGERESDLRRSRSELARLHSGLR